EFFVHHEDVRRAQPDWRPRELPDAQARALWRQLRLLARRSLRRFPATVVVASPGYGEFRAGAGAEAPGTGREEVRVSGDPGELPLFLTGRQRVARVELTGPAETTGRLARARLGV